MRKQTELGDRLIDPSTSSYRKYQDLVVGKGDLLSLLQYEFITGLFGFMPGALGLLLRRFFYPFLLKKAGPGLMLGRAITIRHPSKIRLGDQVVIDDNCVLDAKGEAHQEIRIGSHVFISRNTILSCKGGSIEIGDNCNIASNSLLQSESSLVIGNNVIMAPYCYLVAGGTHSFDSKELPVIQQPSLSKGGILIEENVWLGAKVTVLDGSRIGRDSIIGAGALVMGEIPEYSVAFGSPAKVVRKRN